MGLRRGLSIGFLLGVVAALLGRILSRREQQGAVGIKPKGEAESAAAHPRIRPCEPATPPLARPAASPTTPTSVPNTSQPIDHAAFRRSSTPGAWRGPSLPCGAR